MGRGRIVHAPDAKPIAARQIAPVVPAWSSAANDVVRDAFGVTMRAALTPEEELRVEATRIEGERRTIDAERAQLAALKVRYLERVGQLATATLALARPPAEAILDLALLVARELVGREIELDRQHFLDALAAELTPLCDGERIDVRLPPVDAAEIAKLQPDLAARVRFIPDATLEPGDSVVETSTSVVDRSLAPRLAAVRTALVAALWAGRSEEST